VKRLLLDHLQDHYTLYGEFSGVRTARKHIGWYVKSLPQAEAFREQMNRMEDCGQQMRAVADFFDALAIHTDRMPIVQSDEWIAGAEGRERLEELEKEEKEA
jgi:tRNA-dihydrouridine synthase B